MAKDEWTEDPRRLLMAGPDFDLSSFDRSATPGWSRGKRAAKKAMRSRGKLLSELQERLYAQGRSGGNKRVLVVVQGIDTAGKGGIARHVMAMVDPQGVSLASFGPPTPEEARHHYLWRIRRALPKPGRIGLFDRSHYEDVLVVRVEDLVEEEVWRKRYAEINHFEKGLVDQDTVVIKLALMVSHEEQGMRLMERLDRPDKRWKFSSSDIPTRLKWDAYQEAYADVFRLTSTAHAPWYVLPADNKWYSRLAATEIITRELVEMRVQWPKPRWRPDVQRRRLAETMSPESLARSVAETEEVVLEAIEDSSEVGREAFTLLTEGLDAERRSAVHDALRVKRESFMADLERTIANKRELLAAVDPTLLPPEEHDAPSPDAGNQRAEEQPTEDRPRPDKERKARKPAKDKKAGKGKGKRARKGKKSKN